MPTSAKKMNKSDTLSQNQVESLIEDEQEAISNYEEAIDQTDDAEQREELEHIEEEEQEHIVELIDIDKMKADNMTSEQAWEDFKSGYTDFEEQHIAKPNKSMNKSKDGDTESLSGKLDTLLAIQQEQATDLERITDVLPQVVGEMNEAEEIEEEQEEDDFADDDMSDLFGDDEIDDSLAMDEEEGIVEDTDIGDALDGEEDVDEEDAEEDESFDEDGEEDVDEDADDDYIPIDELTDDDEEDADDEASDDEDEDDYDDILDKMISKMEEMDAVIKAQAKTIDILQKKVKHIEKSRITVQDYDVRKNVAVSRPAPTVRKMIGTVSRPPVSTSFTSNQMAGSPQEENGIVKFSTATPEQILAQVRRLEGSY